MSSSRGVGHRDASSGSRTRRWSGRTQTRFPHVGTTSVPAGIAPKASSHAYRCAGIMRRPPPGIVALNNADIALVQHHVLHEQIGQLGPTHPRIDQQADHRQVPQIDISTTGARPEESADLAMREDVGRHRRGPRIRQPVHRTRRDLALVDGPLEELPQRPELDVHGGRRDLGCPRRDELPHHRPRHVIDLEAIPRPAEEGPDRSGVRLVSGPAPVGEQMSRVGREQPRHAGHSDLL